MVVQQQLCLVVQCLRCRKCNVCRASYGMNEFLRLYDIQSLAENRHSDKETRRAEEAN